MVRVPAMTQIFLSKIIIITKTTEHRPVPEGAWLGAGRPGFDSGYRKSGDSSPALLIETDPGVHSASYKMSTGCFPRG